MFQNRVNLMASSLTMRRMQLRQVSALVGASLLVGGGQYDAGAEHDVEEGVVGGGDVLRPGEEGGALVPMAFACVTLDDGLVDVSDNGSVLPLVVVVASVQIEEKVAEWARVLTTVALHGGVVGDALRHVQGVGHVGGWTL